MILLHGVCTALAPWLLRLLILEVQVLSLYHSPSIFLSSVASLTMVSQGTSLPVVFATHKTSMWSKGPKEKKNHGLK